MRVLVGCERSRVLAPCPGCGGDSSRVIGGPGTAGGPKFWVGCDFCRWRTWGDTEADAIATWNKRAAVGGEAVAWSMRSPKGTIADVVWSTEERDGYLGVGWALETTLYASPPATVDVGALRELVEKLRTRGPSSPMTFNIGTATVSKTPYEVGLAERKLIADELAALIGEKA